MGKLLAEVERDLTLHVRHLAWLSATPKPRPGSKRAEIEAKANIKRVSRAETMKPKGAGPAWEPPTPFNPLPEVAAWLTEVGPVEPAGMGMAPISWQTIDSWCRRTGIEVSPWVARLMRRASTQYLAQFIKAEDENCPPPWHAPVTQAEIDAELDTLRSVLG